MTKRTRGDGKCRYCGLPMSERAESDIAGVCKGCSETAVGDLSYFEEELENRPEDPADDDDDDRSGEE